MTTTTMNLANPKAKEYYSQIIAHMRKQYKDVAVIHELHINERGKVFSAEWTDSKGVINFCGGWAADCVKIVKIKHVKP